MGVLYIKTNVHFFHISLKSSSNEKYCRQKFWRKSEYSFYVQCGFIFENLAVYEIMWEKKYCRAV